MGHRPAISQQHWHASHCRMMNGYTHLFMHTYDTYTLNSYTRTHAKTYRQPTWSGQPGFGIASHTQRQTGVLTVALHYSEPGVGGRGNKVVFISCSLGVL